MAEEPGKGGVAGAAPAVLGQAGEGEERGFTANGQTTNPLPM